MNSLLYAQFKYVYLIIFWNKLLGLPLELVLLKKREGDIKKSSQRRYSEVMKQFAHTLYFYSPKAYHFLRQHFVLPNGRTIRKWLQSVNCEPGILNEVLEFLKQEVKENEYLRNCALIVDAMAIRKQVIWDHSAGKFSGNVNYGGIVEIDFEMAASEALFFQIVSYSRNFKCPVAYFLTNKLDSNLQTQLITSCIRSLFDCGIIIRSITADGAQINISTYKNLGCTLDSENVKCSFPHPNNDKINIHCELDACHMAKLARNSFAEKNLTSPLGKIEWNYIKKLDELQEKEGLRFANSLSAHHIYYKNKIMNVRLAVQSLSSGVADALEYLEKSNLEEFKNCAATVEFIRKFDRVFDMLNSRNPYGKGFKAPIRPENITYFEEVFSDTINYLKSLKIDNVPILNHNRKTFALGLIITMQSTLNLAKNLFSLQNEPLKYFLTYKTSQDHLELFFSCIRSRGGWNNNPNSEQLKWALRQLLLRNTIQPSLNANCKDLGNYCTPAFDFQLDKRNQKLQTKEIDDTENIEKMMEHLGKRTLTDFQENILYYIAGYVVRSLISQSLCDYCVDILIHREGNINDHEYSSPKEDFKKFTTSVTRGSLLYASQIVYDIIIFTEKQFQYFVQNQNVLLGSFNLKRKLSSIATKYFSERKNKFLPTHPVTEEFLSEESHEIQLVRKIVEVFTKCRMHHYSKLRNLKILGTSTSIRQKFTKLILFKNC